MTAAAAPAALAPDIAGPGTGAPAITAGPKIDALSCGKPVYLVILLHEEGAGGQQVIDRALNWAPELPKADFLAAEAPFLAPGGGRCWLPPEATTPEEVAASLRTAGAALEAFIAQMLAARRLPDSHLALIGFSQGAMVALQAGLRRETAPAVVIGFAAALPEADGLADEIRARPPVLLVHGEDDPVVPLSDMVATRERLKALGVPAKSMRRPGLGHGVDDDGILAAGGFLTANLVKKPAKAAAHDDHDHDDHDHDH